MKGIVFELIIVCSFVNVSVLFIDLCRLNDWV